MTNREAAEKLARQKSLLCHDCMHPSMVGWCEEYCQLPEAFDMAISALTAQPETHEKRTETHTCDLIDRQAAIDALKDWYDGMIISSFRGVEKVIKALPPAQPEIKPIEYRDCANAMLRMWMDKVVTDGEYNSIMDKLNSYWRRTDG